MAKSKYKPLSFNTTMRNPERMAGFLSCLVKYEGRILDNEIILSICKEIIQKKLYQPMCIKQIPAWNDVWESEEQSYTSEQLNNILIAAPQHHKEAGFDYGWPSRFDTWFKLHKEYGFVYYSMNERLVITQTGHMLIDAFNSNPPDNNKINNLFLNAMSKYQTHNPYRKTLIKNNPLMLLLEALYRLKKENPDSSGLHRQELSFLICWTNDNVDELLTFIKNWRRKYRFGEYSNELVYEECLQLLGYGDEGKNYIKMSKVTGETVDEYIRKMRITGIFSLRGKGRFLDINTLQNNKIEHLISAGVSYFKHGSEMEYIQYMSSINAQLFDLKAEEQPELDDIKLKTLHNYATDNSKEFVFEEMRKLKSRRDTTDELLKFFPAPVRLEFLASVALLQNFENISVYPSYPIDDEGLPTSTAGGGVADIICKENNTNELVEVTMMCGRNQVNDEMIPITRHLKEAKTINDESFALFVAPVIHPDAERYSKWIKFDENLDIKPIDIDLFIESANTFTSLKQVIIQA